MRRPAAKVAHLKIDLSNETWERLEALAERMERAAAELRHPSGATPVPVKITHDPPLPEHLAPLSETRRAARAKTPEISAEPICVFCGATVDTAVLFRSKEDGIWRCMEHMD